MFPMQTQHERQQQLNEQQQQHIKKQKKKQDEQKNKQHEQERLKGQNRFVLKGQGHVLLPLPTRAVLSPVPVPLRVMYRVLRPSSSGRGSSWHKTWALLLPMLLLLLACAVCGVQGEEAQTSSYVACGHPNYPSCL